MEKILGLEQVCKAAEVAMLQAQEAGADLDAKSQILEALAEDEAEDDAGGNHGASFPASSETYQGALSVPSLSDNGSNGSNDGNNKAPARYCAAEKIAYGMRNTTYSTHSFTPNSDARCHL